jgi:serine/threonine protein kinase
MISTGSLSSESGMQVRDSYASDTDFEANIAAPFEVLEELGRGGMARVFRVLDKRSGQVVALKQMLRARSAELSHQRKQRFELEFQVLSQLSHPRVIEVYDYGLGTHGPYYTMELLDGGDLGAHAPLPWRRACELAYDVCSSLALLHLRRLVHRDVNPRNVRCTSDGHAKLIDFGAMVSMDSAAPLVGSPPFIPPEAERKGTLDARADLFSLGATLYFMLTGELAYPAQDLASLKKCWRIKPQPPSRRGAPDVPPALDRLVMSLLSLEPALRPRSAFEVMQRLKVIAQLARHEPPSVVRAYLATPSLVGRRELLGQVRERLDRALARRGSGVLIAALPGLGRTRMLDEHVLEAKTIGMSVLRATVSSDSQLLDSLTRELEHIAPGQALPSLAPVPTGSSPRSAAARERSAQANSILRAVVRLSREQPLLIVIDDCERLDDVSLGFLCKLVERSHKQALLVLMATCEHPERAPLTGIEVLKGHCDVLPLPLLDLSETEQLLCSVFGDVPNIALLSARIHEIARGNPRETLALAQHLVDRAIIRYEGGCWSLPAQLIAADLPDSTRSLSQQRCARLSPVARALAEIQALALDERFTLHDYHLVADPSDVPAALEELTAAGILAHESGDLYKLGGTPAAVLRESLTDAARHAAYVALARRSEQKARHPFATARFLLLAGELERGVDCVLHAVRRSYSREQLFATTQLGARGNGRLLQRALDAALELGRSARDVFDIRHCLLLMTVSTEEDFYSGEADAFRDQVIADSGLAEYRRQRDDLPPGVRLHNALKLTAARYEATPEHERVYPPAEAIRMLTHYVVISQAESSRRYDLQLSASLPELLEPFAGLSPLVAAIRENAIALLEATLHRQPDRASRRWQTVYDQLGETSGLDADLLRAIRLAIAYGLGLCHAALGMRSALDWVDVLDQDPLQRVNAMYIRKIVRLQHGDLEGAERYRRQAEQLALQARTRQMFYHNINVELGVHAAAWDLTGLQQINARIEPLAQRYKGWQPFRHLGRAHYLRVLGDLAGAEQEYKHAIALAAPDPEQPLRSVLAWPLAVAGLTETLIALDRAEDAHALASAAYTQSQARNMTVYEIVRALGLAEAKLGRYAQGAARLDALIAEQRGLGVTGLNIGSSCEARARAAIWAHDTPAFEHFSELTAQLYRYGRGSMLGVRYERLLEEAQAYKRKAQRAQPIATSARSRA